MICKATLLYSFVRSKYSILHNIACKMLFCKTVLNMLYIKNTIYWLKDDFNNILPILIFIEIRAYNKELDNKSINDCFTFKDVLVKHEI